MNKSGEEKIESLMRPERIKPLQSKTMTNSSVLSPNFGTEDNFCPFLLLHSFSTFSCSFCFKAGICAVKDNPGQVRDLRIPETYP